MTVARYTHPFHVWMYVMSPHHFRSGALAVKSRAIRSGALTGCWPATVVVLTRRGWRPARPAARIRRWTLRCETIRPAAASIARIRRTPGFSRASANNVRISEVSEMSSLARALGAR